MSDDTAHGIAIIAMIGLSLFILAKNVHLFLP